MTTLGFDKYLIPTTIVYISILFITLFNLDYKINYAAEVSLDTVTKQELNQNNSLVITITIVASSTLAFMCVFMVFEDLRIKKIEDSLDKAIDGLTESYIPDADGSNQRAITTLYGIKEAHLKFIIIDENLNVIFSTQGFAEQFNKVCEELIGSEVNSFLSKDSIKELYLILAIPSCRHDAELTLEVGLGNNELRKIHTHVHKYMFDGKHYLLCSS
jgi:hypothetical protein